MSKQFQSCLALLLALVAGCAGAQSFPARPIHIITLDAGSVLDLALRTITQTAAPGFGQPLVVDNRSGNSHPEQAVLKAKPDGYTLLSWANPLWLAPFLQDVDYDVIRDFAPIVLTVRGPTVLVANPGLPAKSVRELVALAKSQPGQLNAAVTAVGTSSSLAHQLFVTMSGAQMVSVPYKSIPQALNDVVAGRIQLMFTSAGTAVPLVKSGKVRALGVTSVRPSMLLPDTPPIADTYPGYRSESIHAVLGAAGTPQAVITRINAEFVKALQDPGVKDKLLTLALEAVGSTPGELKQVIQSEMSTTGKMIKDLGLRAE